ncbi:reprolysin-like metallopeptidase [Chryseobacterium angstadtii]|uniref:reprolysin-like metallopeptidase n=1 Tax=Chryseobacterium angstadtii TaxID=558151 RepID=UPI00065AF0A8|nr:zinc-dependent metalloprotease family protein [Chryseobacterium angstadtii]
MKRKIYLFWALISLGIQSLYSQSLWERVKINEKSVIESKKNIGLDYSNAYSLDINQLRLALKAAPQSKTGMAVSSNVIIEIPTLEGNFEKYTVYETSNMSPKLAEKFPDIKSYRGVSVKGDGKTISFGMSQKGIKLILFSRDKKVIVVEPVTPDGSVYLVSPAVPAHLPLENGLSCKTEDIPANKNTAFVTDNTDDRKFRTYRLAVSVDGEFSAYHGGTVANSIAAINDLMSYINPVYERDLSIHMNLIDNNEAVVFLDATADPYTSANTLNNEVQTTLTNTIGEANYDIGIVFTNQTGGGNAGMIASVCQNSQGMVNGQPDKKKGSAYAGPVNGTGPQGFIYAMVIAHEMGHQYGANHTFSRPENLDYIFITLPETGANREPGSGTTIMGYPGVTGTYDVMDKHSDQFLHYSISQINNYVKTTTCAAIVNLANNPPTVNAGLDYTVPKGTAFKLTAVGSDPDNNAITYSWEEADISAPNPVFVSGSYSFPDRNSTTTPNFRVYPPVSGPVRYFPPLNEVLNGSLYNTWNMVSDVARNMKFISLVRDNSTEGGQTATDETTVSVDASTGPFKVTSISLNQNYASGSTHQLQWNVSGTNAAPINTQSVNILISTDGGTTFTTLVTNTPNDGQESIIIPATPSPKAYIIVESVGNIFFAASPAFAINHNVTLSCNQYPADGVFAVAPNAPANITINVPVTNAIEDINLLMDVSYTDLKNLGMTLRAPTDQQNQIFWYQNCPGISVLKATFDQEGQSLPMNCNNLNATPNTRIEPIRLDLSRYYGQNPNGNWIIRAQDTVTNSTASGNVNAAAIELCTRVATASNLSVNDLELGKDDFQIYPNPSDGRFNVVMKNKVSGTAHVFDMSGRLLHTQEKVANDSKINLTGFAKGNYILMIETDTKKLVKKIIIK